MPSIYRARRGVSATSFCPHFPVSGLFVGDSARRSPSLALGWARWARLAYPRNRLGTQGNVARYRSRTALRGELSRAARTAGRFRSTYTYRRVRTRESEFFARLWGAGGRKFSGNLLVFVSQAHLPHGNCARDVARARGWSELDQRASSPAPELGLPGCANSAQLLLRGKGASVGLVTGRSRVATRRLSDEPGGYGLRMRRPDGVYGGLGDPGCGALLFHDRGSIARGRRAHGLQAGAEHQVNR